MPAHNLRYDTGGVATEGCRTLKTKPLYIMHLSLHGLIRGTNPEIGCDADTGGQVRYVLDLMQALGRDSRVRKVDLLTRRISDPRVSPDYDVAHEPLSRKASIRRIAFGPGRYIRKEMLWPHLSECIDEILAMVRSQRDVPDVLHAHYADAGLVASRLSKVLGVPIIFTGHSLGRFKLANLLARGRKKERLYETFSFAERIEAEEETIENASLIIASSRNEEDEQYKRYDHYNPKRIMVNPPGCDLDRYGSRPGQRATLSLHRTLERFLDDITRPPLILLARLDPQKNILAAIRIFARPELRQMCNLILFLGARDDFRESEPAQRKLMQEVLHLIDKHDLYGRIAYPKHNPPEMAAALFHFAHDGGGALLAPSRHENFGLTLVEAAAAGLPVASSGVGGMKDILDMCGHGITINPDDAEASAKAIRKMLVNRKRWLALSQSGRAASRAKLTWASHIERYVPVVQSIVAHQALPTVVRKRPIPLGTARYLLVSDIDDTLTGDRKAIGRLNSLIRKRNDLIFGVATGRHVKDAMATLKAWSVAEPQFLITSVGTEIYTNFGQLLQNEAWQRHIQFRWRPERVREVLRGLADLEPQEAEAQTRFKISYYCDNAGEHTVAAVKSLLRTNLLQARVLVSKQRCVDVIPVRASKGHALRFLATQWRFELSNVIAAGDSGNDLDILRGVVKGIVVANHSNELENLRTDPATYFARRQSAAGILEGLEHYGLSV